MRYLIAETDWRMMSLATDLAARGTLVSRTDRPEDLAHYLHLGAPDLLIAEAGVFGPGGLPLRTLREAHPGMPIALMGARPDLARMTECLAAGADTVIDMGLNTAETAARLMAVARRAHGLATSEIRHGPLRIDLAARRARVGEVVLQLTPKVYEVLEYLALRPGQLVTRDALLNHVYGLESEPESRVFDVYICTLRARLRDVCGCIDIQTARGAGFRFVAPGRGADAA